MTEDRSGVPGTGLGLALPSPAVPLHSTRHSPRASLQILPVWMLGGTATLKSPTLTLTLRIPPPKSGGCQ